MMYLSQMLDTAVEAAAGGKGHTIEVEDTGVTGLSLQKDHSHRHLQTLPLVRRTLEYQVPTIEEEAAAEAIGVTIIHTEDEPHRALWRICRWGFFARLAFKKSRVGFLASICMRLTGGNLKPGLSVWCEGADLQNCCRLDPQAYASR